VARLSKGNMTLEIRFKEYDEQRWVQYEILFLYRDVPLISDTFLKRINEHWNKRSPGAFKANEFQRDSLILVLERAIQTNQPQQWKPLEPDIVVKILRDDYSSAGFDTGQSEIQILEISPELVEHAKQAAMVRDFFGGRLPDDVFELTVFIDIYNFGEERGYQGIGPALVITASRRELHSFVEELKAEYAEFCIKWNVAEESN
jgi:hypothetical protein